MNTLRIAMNHSLLLRWLLGRDSIRVKPALGDSFICVKNNLQCQLAFSSQNKIQLCIYYTKSRSCSNGVRHFIGPHVPLHRQIRVANKIIQEEIY